MKLSLKIKLNNLIRERGEISYGDLMQYVAELGYRGATAERRLRASESPEVEPIMGYSQRHTQFVKSYRWKGSPAPKKPIIKIEGNKAVMIYQ